MPAIDEQGLAKVAKVKETAEKTGIVWDDLTTEQKASLYRDYTGEEIATEKMEEFVTKGSGGTMAGNVFVADNPFEGIAALGATYKGNKKREELSKQKAQAYELAGGLAAGEANAQRQQQMQALAMLQQQSQPPPPPKPPNQMGQTPPPGPPQGPPPGPPQGPPGAMPPQGGQPMPQQIGAEQSMIMQGKGGTMGGSPMPPPGAMPPQQGGPPPGPPQGPPSGMQLPSGMQMPTGPAPGPQQDVSNSPQFKKIMEQFKLEEMLKRLRAGG